MDALDARGNDNVIGLEKKKIGHDTKMKKQLVGRAAEARAVGRPNACGRYEYGDRDRERKRRRRRQQIAGPGAMDGRRPERELSARHL